MTTILQLASFTVACVLIGEIIVYQVKKKLKCTSTTSYHI